MNILQLVKAGGVTMIALLAVSVASVAIILERVIFYYSKSRLKRKDLMSRVRHELKKGGVNPAMRICKDSNAPFAR
jgi:biopolymer transport protein ExbB/TolQ